MLLTSKAEAKRVCYNELITTEPWITNIRLSLKLSTTFTTSDFSHAARCERKCYETQSVFSLP